MYIQNRWKIKGEIEVENIYSGRYGKRTSPSERKVPTSEEQERINEQQCVRKLRRKIHANFDKDDLFETLTYRRDCRPDPKCAARSNRKGVIFISLLTPENPSDSPDHHLSEAENTGYCLLTYNISLVLPHSRSVYQLQWYPLPQQSGLQAVRR